MTMVKFTATKLAAKGKKGILTPDENGYYTMIIGGLNAFNSTGLFYTLKGAEDLFKSSSIFMRRVASGNMKGELGHPKRSPDMSDDDYLSRILTVEETNVCCHFKEIWLDHEYGKNHPELKNPGLVAIMAKVKPSGPKGDALKKSFDNPDENVCFSIRSLTREFWARGIKHREINTIASFDCVTEPGISVANKWDAPALEQLAESNVTKKSLESYVNRNVHMVGMESSTAIATEALNSLFPSKQQVVPVYSKW
jgi:hypothetical protein